MGYSSDRSAFRLTTRKWFAWMFSNSPISALSPVVRHGRHAVAVDEMREDFAPTLWNADPRISQVLFVGAHGDVGGGYADSDNECALSDITLKWMTGELAQAWRAFFVIARYRA